MQPRTLIAIGCVVVTLVACGGGGSSSSSDIGLTPPPAGSTGAVPASAFQSVDAFVAFVRSLASGETNEPLTLPTGTPPTSDTAEPAG